MANNNGAIGWDDEVSASDAGEKQLDEFVILPDGNYPFEVVKVVRGSYKGSSKIPPCNEVKVDIILDGGDAGRSYVTKHFYMHTSCLWKIFQFLESVGLRKKGDTTAARIPWAKVVKGLTGKAIVNSREYNGKTYNDVEKWLPSEDTDDFDAAF